MRDAAAGAGEIVATRLSVDESRGRLLRAFAPWPRFGLRWSTRRGYAIELDDDEFVLRALPRLGASPLFEAWGRWREGGGVIVETRPMALAYMPLVLANALALCVLFTAALLLAARSDIQSWIQLSGIGVVVLFVAALAAQLLVMAVFEWRNGARERAQLVAAVREALGP